MFDEEADVVIKCGGGASDGGCGPSIDKSCAWSVASWAFIAKICSTWAALAATFVRQAKKRRRFAHSFEPIAPLRGATEAGGCPAITAMI